MENLSNHTNNNKNIHKTNKRFTTRDIGKHYENMARRYLETQGLKTIAQNYHCPLGEIDIIMSDDDVVAFVEVRYRKCQDFGGGIGSIDYKKQQKIIRASHFFLKSPKYQHHLKHRGCRFDVVSIHGKSTLNWVKQAFEDNHTPYF